MQQGRIVQSKLHLTGLYVSCIRTTSGGVRVHMELEPKQTFVNFCTHIEETFLNCSGDRRNYLD